MAQNNGLDLYIDTSYFRYPYKPYYLRHRVRHQLPDLGLNERELGKAAGMFVGAVTQFTKGARLYNRLTELLRLQQKLPRVAYDMASLQKALANPEPYLILKGYWQNYALIEEYVSHIREQFDLVPDTADADYSDDIAGCFSTAVHLRLGDYVNDPLVAATYARLSPDYYSRSMDRVRAAAGSRECRFFIFSNDLEQARHIIGEAPDITYIAGIDNDIREFKLMVACHSQIISNSTFSWWAALLNREPEKMVVAPRDWFTDKNRAEDIWIPAEWIREVN